MSLEHRQTERYNVEVSAEVYTTNTVISAKTKNLSDTGICIDLSNELAENSTIGISLFLTHEGIEDPDAELLNIKAHVVWSSPREDQGFSSGLKFDDNKDSENKIIATFLSQIS